MNDKIRALAAQGMNSHQIAAETGIVALVVGDRLRQMGLFKVVLRMPI